MIKLVGSSMTWLFDLCTDQFEIFSGFAVSVFRPFSTRYCSIGYPPMSPSLKIRSLEVRSHRVNPARNNTYFAKLKKRYFLFAPPPTSGTGPLQTIPHSWTRRAGLVPGVARGRVTSKIEACII